MLRIYDDTLVTRRTRMKRLQVLSLFAGGVLCGGWLTGNNPPFELLSTAKASKGTPARHDPGSWCQGAGTRALHLDCSLTFPDLPRADDV